MKKLLVAVLLLMSPYALAKDNITHGKIRFIGQVTAPSCDITTTSKSSHNINLANCTIANDQTHHDIQKLHITTRSIDPKIQNLIRVHVVYK